MGLCEKKRKERIQQQLLERNENDEEISFVWIRNPCGLVSITTIGFLIMFTPIIDVGLTM
jgi:hypothetical protein